MPVIDHLLGIYRRWFSKVLKGIHLTGLKAQT